MKSLDLNTNGSYFEHLNFANQTYLEHFKDSIYYCIKSIESSFYFLCHAIWPDIFQQAGSDTIHHISNIIKKKYKKRMDEIESNNSSYIDAQYEILNNV